MARSQILNQERRYNQAEALLRQVLTRMPAHPEALFQLNRALMHGRVYGESRWELLEELARQGRTILETTDDEEMHRQMAQTLLAIPSMREAVAFLELWIGRCGPDMERLGMLAWARACTGEHARAEEAWAESLALAERSTPDQDLTPVPFIAYTLAECWTAAGERERARRAALQAWALCQPLGSPAPEVDPQAVTRHGLPADTGWLWLSTFHQAGLELQDAARTLLEWLGVDTGPAARAAGLCVRCWVDEPDCLQTDWLAWVRERLAKGEERLLDRYRGALLRGLRARGQWQAANHLARATWELLGQAGTAPADQQRVYWSWGAALALARRFAPKADLPARFVCQAGAYGDELTSGTEGNPTSVCFLAGVGPVWLETPPSELGVPFVHLELVSARLDGRLLEPEVPSAVSEQAWGRVKCGE